KCFSASVLAPSSSVCGLRQSSRSPVCEHLLSTSPVTPPHPELWPVTLASHEIKQDFLKGKISHNEKERQNDKWLLLNSFHVGTAFLKDPLNDNSGLGQVDIKLASMELQDLEFALLGFGLALVQYFPTVPQ
ncbi:hypothetical protein STEG23_005315, partial [Scotinomys teguina]